MTELAKAALVVAEYGKTLEAMASTHRVRIPKLLRDQLSDVGAALQVTASIISAHTCEVEGPRD